MIYTNFIGSITLIKYNKSRYCLFLIKNTIHIIENKLFKTKSQIKETIFKYINKIKQQLKLKFKAFKSDNKERYINKKLEKKASDNNFQ